MMERRSSELGPREVTLYTELSSLLLEAPEGGREWGSCLHIMVLSWFLFGEMSLVLTSVTL